MGRRNAPKLDMGTASGSGRSIDGKAPQPRVDDNALQRAIEDCNISGQERTSARSPQVNSRTRGRPCGGKGNIPRCESLARFSWATEIWSDISRLLPGPFRTLQSASPVSRRPALDHVSF